MAKHRTPRAACPSCGKRLDAATNVSDDWVPKPDDITICLYCGHLMAFDSSLKFRELSQAEMRLVAGDKRILAIQRARGAIIK